MISKIYERVKICKSLNKLQVFNPQKKGDKYFMRFLLSPLHRRAIWNDKGIKVAGMIREKIG
ncbi:MAG: hypothetical protein WC472_02000 [Candidatus Paceibacterota bacterium]